MRWEKPCPGAARDVNRARPGAWSPRLVFGPLAEGRAEARADGRTEGQTAALADAVLAVLDARGLRITKAARERVRACADAGVLERWVRRAAVVERAADLFAEP